MKKKTKTTKAAGPAAAKTAVKAPAAKAPARKITATTITARLDVGFGNTLYLRGEGPGLSWDKGVPLTFVSIGKWRWESADASAPVKGRLLKNDEIESPLGLLTLVPGQQLAVTATF